MHHQMWLGSKLHGWTGPPLYLTWNADYLLVLLQFSFLLFIRFLLPADYCVTNSNTQFFVWTDHPWNKQPFIQPLKNLFLELNILLPKMWGFCQAGNGRNEIWREKTTFIFFWAFAFFEYHQFLVLQLLSMHIFPFIIFNSENCEQQPWGEIGKQKIRNLSSYY